MRDTNIHRRQETKTHEEFWKHSYSHDIITSSYAQGISRNMDAYLALRNGVSVVALVSSDRGAVMDFSIQGQLNNMKLPVSKCMWPLFEAVVNSVQAIEDLGDTSSGKISIFAQRISSGQLRLDQRETLERFESFTIEDNGIGLDSSHYSSFNTAYSTFNVKKGCKGIGRFLWLKAFTTVTISSTFSEDGKYYKREFSFNTDGIAPEDNLVELTDSDAHENKTVVNLEGFRLEYQSEAPVELDTVAKRIIEHCLPFFISGSCPTISISDGVSDSINLNSYYKEHIEDSLHQEPFRIKDHDFRIYHIRVPELTSGSKPGHRLYLCANLQEVVSCDLKKHIPDLQRKICPTDGSQAFYYAGYVTSSYLDEIVNATRTKFEFDERDEQISLSGTGEKTIISTAINFIEGYLADYISDLKKQKKRQIDDYVAYNKPTYRYMLNVRPQTYDKIPAGLSTYDLELELHKQVQEWETEIKIQGENLEKAEREGTTDTESFRELYEKYWAQITELSMVSLAEYVVRRKAILTLLENALTRQPNGRFPKERAIHSIICPMRHTSDEIEFEEMNLWIIDERLAYHKFLASDKPISSLPFVDSSSSDRLDLAIYDCAFAYTEDENLLNTVTIVEFKKPDNTKDNPISQVGRYIDEIMDGRKKRASGLSFGASPQTQFRCYIICDLTSQMETNCKDASMEKTPDGMGYYNYNKARNAYFEVISYSKLLADAKKRNQILFDKLFSPNMNNILHNPQKSEPKPQND